jgi:lipoprotein-releasing system ATP-binding protein
MLQTNNITFHYDIKQPFHIPDILLNQGEKLLIIGKSGSGKTTILNIIGGLLKPHTGTVEINQTSIYNLTGSKLDSFRGQHIGIIFQKPHILAPLTVEENLKIANFFAKQDSHRNLALLEELGIAHKRKAKIHTLSEGEAQRVSIARALANGPKLILADEPTASLDDENAASVIELLMYQAEKHKAALVIVTHDQRVKKHISNQIQIGGSK